MLPLLGKLTPTEQAVRDLHDPKKCPKHPDPLTLWAVATVYDLDLDDLDSDAADAINNVIQITEARRRHPRQGRRGPARNVPSEQVKRMNPGTFVSAGQGQRVA